MGLTNENTSRKSKKLIYILPHTVVFDYYELRHEF